MNFTATSGCILLLLLAVFHCYFWLYFTATSGCISMLLLAIFHCYFWLYFTATSGCILLLLLAVFHCYFWLYFTATSGCILLLSMVTLDLCVPGAGRMLSNHPMSFKSKLGAEYAQYRNTLSVFAREDTPPHEEH